MLYFKYQIYNDIHDYYIPRKCGVDYLLFPIESKKSS